MLRKQRQGAFVMNKTAQRIQARARELARSGTFIGWRQLEFELSFEKDFAEARDWLNRATTREELDRLCRKARARRLSAQATAGEAA
jgi:hypothetical protein